MRVAAAGWGDSQLPPSPLNSIFVGVATGQSYADALTGGAFMALANGPLLLTPTPPTVAASTLAARKADNGALLQVCLFGGRGVIPDAAGAQIYTVVGATRSHDYFVPF